MTSARWQEIKRVLDLIGEATPEVRAGVLTAACGGDQDLRREVESLPRFGEKAVALDEAARAMHVHVAQGDKGQVPGPAREFRLAPGARLGPYEILKPPRFSPRATAGAAEDQGRNGTQLAPPVVVALFSETKIVVRCGVVSNSAQRRIPARIISTHGYKIWSNAGCFINQHDHEHEGISIWSRAGAPGLCYLMFSGLSARGPAH